MGLLASLVKSGLKIPDSIKKFLSIYLLISIGMNGGYEIFNSGLTIQAISVIACCMLFSFISPFIMYQILKTKESKPNAVMIASSYGSVSAVTFITAVSVLTYLKKDFDGYMTAALALMESPAIISGLIIYNLGNKPQSFLKMTKEIFHKSVLDPHMILLLGSIIIGFLCQHDGKTEMEPFTTDLFKGMLTLYLLDMGIIAGSQVSYLRKSGAFLILFALICPIINALIGISVAYCLHLSIGNALLLTVLFGSASYIAVPAILRMSIPEANAGMVIQLSLIVTFLFNVVVGIPIYYDVLKWG